MKLPKTFLVFDIESVGLHGEGFAVGYVLIDQLGTELESGLAMCPDASAFGIPSDRDWIRKNVRPALDEKLDPPPTRLIAYVQEPKEVRDFFWKVWIDCKLQYKDECLMAADCSWPVEARFLNQCVDDFPKARREQGPYPFIDITSLILATGKDPLESFGRLTNELPEHNPLADARQSARILIESLKALKLLKK
jgi:hypothetical protein